MAHTLKIKAQLLKDNEGTFNADDGRKVNYHNATFFDLDGQRIFKANIGNAPVPPVAKPLTMSFDVILGEKFTKLEYVGCE